MSAVQSPPYFADASPRLLGLSFWRSESWQAPGIRPKALCGNTGDPSWSKGLPVTPQGPSLGGQASGIPSLGMPVLGCDPKEDLQINPLLCEKYSQKAAGPLLLGNCSIIGRQMIPREWGPSSFLPREKGPSSWWVTEAQRRENPLGRRGLRAFRAVPAL